MSNLRTPNLTRETEITEADDSVLSDISSISEKMKGLQTCEIDSSPGKSFLRPTSRVDTLRDMAKGLYHSLPRRNTVTSTAKNAIKASHVPRRESYLKENESKSVQTEAGGRKSIDSAVQTELWLEQNCLTAAKNTINTGKSEQKTGKGNRKQTMELQIRSLKTELTREKEEKRKIVHTIDGYITEVRRLKALISSKSHLNRHKSQLLTELEANISSNPRNISSQKQRLAVEFQLASVETQLRALQLDCSQ